MIPATAAARGALSDLPARSGPCPTSPVMAAPFTAGWPRSLVAAPGGSPLMTSAASHDEG